MSRTQKRQRRVKANPERPTARFVSPVVCRVTYQGQDVQTLRQLVELSTPYARDHVRVDNGSKLVRPGVVSWTVSTTILEAKKGQHTFPCGLAVQVLKDE